MLKKIFSIGNEKFIYYFFLGLLLIDRALLLTAFSFKYVGSDDLIFWQSATDYMQGLFHEPYFYGQNYNFMLESIIAIPLLKIGVPYYIAFPVCTSFLALFPFFLFSFVLFKKGYFIEALIFISLPILLPIEYTLLTSITRGFISGLFFSGFLIFSLFNKTKKSLWIISALALSLGYIFNPNSLIIAIPICFYIFLNNFKKPLYYLINVLIIIPVWLIEFFSKQFYIKNPEFNVHGMWNLHFEFEHIFNSFSHLDKFFTYFMPVLWSMGWLILILILTAGIYLLFKDREKGLALVLSIILAITFLGINKVNDHIDSIFLSSTRMFLAIPLLTGLAFMWIKKHIRISDQNWIYILSIIIITTFFIKSSLYPTVVKNHTQITNYGPVAIKKIKDLKCECTELKSIAQTNNIDLILFVPDWKYNVPHMEFYNYGCPIFEKGLPPTILNVYEKRTWVYVKEKTSIHKNILILTNGIDSTKLNEIKDFEVIPWNPSIYIIKENNLTTEDLLNKLGFELKRNNY